MIITDRSHRAFQATILKHFPEIHLAPQYIEGHAARAVETDSVVGVPGQSTKLMDAESWGKPALTWVLNLLISAELLGNMGGSSVSC